MTAHQGADAGSGCSSDANDNAKASLILAEPPASLFLLDKPNVTLIQPKTTMLWRLRATASPPGPQSMPV